MAKQTKQSDIGSQKRRRESHDETIAPDHGLGKPSNLRGSNGKKNGA